MPSLIGALMNNEQRMNDQTIANDMLMGAKSGAAAYLTATLESSTPEIRALFSSSLNQMVTGHAALTELAVKRGWYKPYDIPEQQLAEALDQSHLVIKATE